MSAIIIKALQKVGAKSVLDFGCGNGDFVRLLSDSGFNAFGCDIGADWPSDEGDWQRSTPAEKWVTDSRLFPIQARPYRLPFPDESFDAVVSTSVFEHVENKAEAFSEISRVLKVGGRALHLFPSRWRLPVEPHIFVPLVPQMWPNVPQWWLSVWALLGIRNGPQKSKGWREVARLNKDYIRHGLSYWSVGEYAALAPGKAAVWSDFYVEASSGRAARIAKKLRLPPALVSWFREILLVVEK